MNKNMYKYLPLRFKEHNTSSVFYTGSIWQTHKSGTVVVLGFDGRFVYDKHRRPHYRRIIVQFEDGTKLSVDRSALSRGDLENPNRQSVYNRGFVGIGEFITHTNRTSTKEYKLWSGMFIRCYDPQTHKTHPTYKDCEVDERWWNFQTFCWDILKLKNYDHWRKSQSAYHLDKDIKVKGNKLYSKDTCMFVTARENSREAKTNKIKYDAFKDGIFVDTFTSQRDFARKYGISEASLSRLVKKVYPQHKGWTIREHKTEGEIIE